MSLYKRIIFILISLLAIAVLWLRIVSVIREESSTTIFSDLNEESEFVAAIYSPIVNKIVLDDSTKFFPGTIYVQDAVKLKHHFYIFSSYYEKSPSKNREVTYQSEGHLNKSMLVLKADRDDTIFQEMVSSKEKIPKLDFYTLNHQVMDAQNRKFDIAAKGELDTLKFYIKKAFIKPYEVAGTGKIVSEYYIHTITLGKEPVDSLLYVRKK